MRPATRVNDHRMPPVRCSLNAIQHLPFVVALEEFHRHAQACCLLGDEGFDVSQRRRPVDLRLALAHTIEVRSVEDAHRQLLFLCGHFEIASKAASRTSLLGDSSRVGLASTSRTTKRILTCLFFLSRPMTSMSVSKSEC